MTATAHSSAHADLQQAARDHLWMHFTRMSGYASHDVPIIVRGDGCYLEDANGKRYLDALAGLFSVNLGYGFGELRLVGDYVRTHREKGDEMFVSSSIGGLLGAKVGRRLSPSTGSPSAVTSEPSVVSSTAAVGSEALSVTYVRRVGRTETLTGSGDHEALDPKYPSGRRGS